MSMQLLSTYETAIRNCCSMDEQSRIIDDINKNRHHLTREELIILMEALHADARSFGAD